MPPGYLLTCVIAVAFVGAAAWASWQFAESCVLFARLRNAVSAPARIVSLRREGGKRPYIVATYTYEFEGKAFSSDTRGHFSWSKYRDGDLKRLKENRTPLSCFVDPDDPSVSVLDNTFSLSRFVVSLAFASVFLGGALVTSVVAYNEIRHQLIPMSATRPEDVP
ncbi:DUF3592 domain-containing protein [Candidatus Laterigemmans baculatus]|uniref:DUF3592 domain-containing protein n=1 Tax=Candidatus Laterigemmans baculatus TaxID=2770505 RepID=UPI0013DA54D8